MLRSLTLAVVVVAVILALVGASEAGGLFLTEIGTNEVGLAGAGWAARAQDASTLFRNPAGMSFLDGNSQAMFGAQLLYGDIKFTNGGSSGFLGTGNGGNPVDVFPSASGFYSRNIGHDFAVGFGVFSNFGLGLKYTGGDWVGRYYAQESMLAGVSFVPSASYRINDKISIGGGLNIMVAQLKYITAINQGPLQGDGSIRLQDVTAGVGGIFGVMIEPMKGTRFGVTYYSPVKLDFGSTPSYNNLGTVTTGVLNAAGLIGNRIDLGITVPQHVIVSAYHELTDRLALMADVGWENWSQFGKVDVSISETGTSATTNIPYNDTVHVGFGGRYKLNPDWLVNSGFAYDSSMVDDQHRSVALPVGSTYKFGLGAEWQATEKYNIGMNYELTWIGDMPVNQQAVLPGPVASRGTVSGGFNNSSIHFFSANVRF